ncbi:MAG: divalent cation tolerance protein CutA [Candidatus Omnitrophota bacterium]
MKKKLAACVNITGRIESIFKWKGKLERAKETLLIIKTTASSFQRLTYQIKKLHSYEVPEIIALDIKKGEKNYLKWIKNAVLGVFIFFIMTVQSPGAVYPKDYNICVLKPQDIEPYELALNGFEDALKKAGYENGKNVTYFYYNMNLDPFEAEAMLEDINRDNPDLILALGLESALACKEGARRIPVVFSVVADPVSAGLVKSMENPGNNITGAAINISPRSQLEMLKVFVPNMQRVGIIYNPDILQKKIDEIEITAEEMGIQIVLEPVASYKEVPEAIRGLTSRIDALWLLADPTVANRQALEYIFVRTLWVRKPVMGFSAYLVRTGALFAMNYDYYDIGAQSGELAVKILQGSSPGKLPVTTPRKTDLTINMKIANRLGVKVPPQLAEEAKEIIQ